MKLITALVLLWCVQAHAQTTALRQTEGSFSGQVAINVGYRYLLYLPKGYESSQDKKWPLVVFLHGSGERGNNLAQLAKHGPPKLIAAGQDFPAIIASPQAPDHSIWNPHGVKALTDDLARQYRVDVNRTYLTGLSMGGFGTWDTAFEYPDTYAAIIPICGGAGVRFVMADRIKHIPAWIFHGAKDPVVDPAFSKQMNDVLNKLGASVKFTLYPDMKHDSWTATYDNPDVWKWLFEQHR